MSFTSRVVIGNAVSVIIAVAATAALNQNRQIWLDALIGTVVLVGLAEYTTKHFAGEERDVDQTKYPELTQHKTLHKKLLDQVTELIGKFNAGEPLIAQDVINFLNDWLINHIKGVDMRYGPHLNKSGVK